MSLSEDIIDIFDVKILHKYCGDISEGKNICHHWLKNNSWLIIGICKSTVKTVQQPLQQGNSPTPLYMNIVQEVKSLKGNFVQLFIATVFVYVLTESSKGLDIPDKIH